MGLLRDNVAARRLEMDEAGLVVFANYRLEPGVIIVDHVEAPPPLRGTGASGRFMQTLAEDARARGLRIVPVCGYAATWLLRHAEYRDLIA